MGKETRSRVDLRALALAIAATLLEACSSAPASGSGAPSSGGLGDDAGGAAGGFAEDAGASAPGDDGAAVADAATSADAGASDDGGARVGAPSGDGGADSGGDANPSGLRVVMGANGAAGHLVDGSGSVVQLHGVDRSGTEFACLNGGFFDGPADQAGVDAMKTWNVNAVRVPLNEDCWLGINGVAAAQGGANYQAAIKGWVDLLTQNEMFVIVDLHWTAPGTTLSNSQAPMPDADHSPTVWSQVAGMFASNPSVIFDLFNEPYVTDWGCWVSGGSCAQLNGATYDVAGMASLLQAVRTAGASNVVMLGGLAYSSDMSQWVTSVASIPKLAAPLAGISLANVAASWHAYDFNGQAGCPSQYNGYSTSMTCDAAATTAMNTSATSVLAAGYPVIIGETGISAYSASSAASFSSAQVSELQTWLDDLLTWADGQGQGYLGWSWNTDTPPLLVTDYSGTPSPDFGETYQAHLKKF